MDHDAISTETDRLLPGPSSGRRYNEDDERVHFMNYMEF